MFSDLNERSRAIFKSIVDSYLESGEPVGSRTLSKSYNLSPASIRNTMADLEDIGLLAAPHTSAGRIPTEMGLRFYVDGLMQKHDLSDDERKEIHSAVNANSMAKIFEQASALLTNLSSCASLVVVPVMDAAVSNVQFVQLDPRRVLTVLMMSNGVVENRIFETSVDLPGTSLLSAANYLNQRLKGKKLNEAQIGIQDEIRKNQTQLDQISTELVQKGLAWGPPQAGQMIVRGQSRLLEDIDIKQDLERVRLLIARLEEQETMLGVLDLVKGANGVKVFIGSENKQFSSCSTIVAPWKNGQDKIVGAIGVIAPLRTDYARIVPLVDYTTTVIQKLLEYEYGG